jgi:hypothetical protein
MIIFFLGICLGIILGFIIIIIIKSILLPRQNIKMSKEERSSIEEIENLLDLLLKEKILISKMKFIKDLDNKIVLILDKNKIQKYAFDNSTGKILKEQIDIPNNLYEFINKYIQWGSYNFVNMHGKLVEIFKNKWSTILEPPGLL